MLAKQSFLFLSILQELTFNAFDHIFNILFVIFLAQTRIFINLVRLINKDFFFFSLLSEIVLAWSFRLFFAAAT